MNSAIESKQFTIYGYIQSLSMLIALVILIDFITPGKIYTDIILDVKKERQQYYNAARNYHSSYKVFTKRFSFNIPRSLAKEVKLNKKITYTVSPIFKEVNYSSHIKSKNRNMYSLRLFTGLILPLMVILIIVLSFKYRNRIDILSFVFQISLIGDFIYLLQ